MGKQVFFSGGQVCGVSGQVFFPSGQVCGISAQVSGGVARLGVSENRCAECPHTCPECPRRCFFQKNTCAEKARRCFLAAHRCPVRRNRCFLAAHRCSVRRNRCFSREGRGAPERLCFGLPPLRGLMPYGASSSSSAGYSSRRQVFSRRLAAALPYTPASAPKPVVNSTRPRASVSASSHRSSIPSTLTIL